jgi:hypothetical protein
MIGTTEFSVTARLGTTRRALVRSRTLLVESGQRLAQSRSLTKVASQIGGVEKAIVDVREDLNQRATAAACRSLVVASDRGETVGEVAKI